MSTLVHTRRPVSRRPGAGFATFRMVLASLGQALRWPLRVYANRKLLQQMVGMSAYELADIGLTPADLQDTAALSPDVEVGLFLATRADARRRAWHDRRV